MHIDLHLSNGGDYGNLHPTLSKAIGKDLLNHIANSPLRVGDTDIHGKGIEGFCRDFRAKDGSPNLWPIPMRNEDTIKAADEEFSDMFHAFNRGGVLFLDRSPKTRFADGIATECDDDPAFFCHRGRFFLRCQNKSAEQNDLRDLFSFTSFKLPIVTAVIVENISPTILDHLVGEGGGDEDHVFTSPFERQMEKGSGYCISFNGGALYHSEIQYADSNSILNQRSFYFNSLRGEWLMSERRLVKSIIPI